MISIHFTSDDHFGYKILIIIYSKLDNLNKNKKEKYFTSEHVDIAGLK